MTRERDRIQENANKYIVKNCPCGYAIADTIACTCNEGYQKWCEYTDDCLVKQVIDKCKCAVSNYSNLEILRTACETSEAYGKAVMANEILQLFDIEEVSE